MSWFVSKPKPWYFRLGISVLKAGPMPKHIAIIMDGNRRYAKAKKLDRRDGHVLGFKKLIESFDWCLFIGIKELTVYAFSIENFKRSKDEVEFLMELATIKFQSLLDDMDNIQKNGIRIRILGDIKLLPLYLQKIMAELIISTKDNTRFTLNICFAYTSREEISTAMRHIVKGVNSGLLKESDVSEELLEKCLYTEQSLCPDMLIRTSGEVRLSDFMLWQSSYSCLLFEDVYWPSFNEWHMMICILKYQRNFPQIQKAIQGNSKMKLELDTESDTRNVEKEMHKYELNPVNVVNMKYGEERRKRTDNFLQSVYNNREMYLKNLLANKDDSI